MKFTATIFAFAFAAGMAAALPGHPHAHPSHPPPNTVTSTISSSTTAPPPERTVSNSNGSCSVGKPQCCNSLLSEADASKQADLVGLTKLAGLVGLQCQHIPINVIGVAAELDNQCKTTPVCCQDTAQNGLVHLGCSPISVN